MKNFKPLFALILPLLLFGCMTPTQQSDLLTKVDRLEKEVATLKAEVKGVNDRSGKLVADAGADLDNMRREFDVMRGKFEERDYRLKKIEDSLELMQGSIHSIDDQLKKNESNGGSSEDIKKSIEEIEARVAALEKAPSGVATKESSDPKTLYSEALNAIRKDKDYKKGAEKLERLLAKHPKHELAGNAQYWIGEAFYADGDYERAIVEFQKVMKNHPKSDKIAPALLKQGLAFEKLKDNESAEAIYTKITDEYAKSTEAKTAKERLKEIKKAAPKKVITNKSKKDTKPSTNDTKKPSK